MARVTLDRLDQKLDDVLKRLIEHTETFKVHAAEDRQIAIVVDRLDQKEKTRTWHIRAIWSALIAAVIAYFTKG